MVALANPKYDNRKTRENPAGTEGEWESVRLAATSRRRWKWGLLAGALIFSGGFAGAWAGLASEDTHMVAVLAADLPAGHVLTAQDVSPVEAEGIEGLRLLAPDAVEGMALSRPMTAGSPLVAGSVADSGLWPEPGTALLAVPVATVPQDMEPGASVDLIATRPAPDEAVEEAGPGEDGSGSAPGVVTGLVHRVASGSEDGFGGGHQVVEVVLPRDRAARFSQASAGGDVQVALVDPREGTRTGAAGEDE
ncbi:SAF domain-containing protein [Nocardiopsis sp. N85]|uniref:SAF domain-containing protein n=1 Tax=Nocardiopsis sp. N85 TaxID=3029400 RepID=UPI00237FBCD3|nr:SAF domain-containing protein [Nocardiopsis sp. N85]MDE3721442.1 SAF domain-containing protein [Nocardiopsis sp. N85]